MQNREIFKRLNLASWLVSVNKMEKPTHKVGFVWPTSESNRKALINTMQAKYGGCIKLIESICS